MTPKKTDLMFLLGPFSAISATGSIGGRMGTGNGGFTELFLAMEPNN